MATAGTVRPFEIVAGWTDPLDFDLLADKAIPAAPLTGTVELVLKKADGTIMPTTGDVSITDATNWRVRYSPDADDLVVGNYQGRFKITGIDTKVKYAPSGVWMEWKIRAEG